MDEVKLSNIIEILDDLGGATREQSVEMIFQCLFQSPKDFAISLTNTALSRLDNPSFLYYTVTLVSRALSIKNTPGKFSPRMWSKMNEDERNLLRRAFLKLLSNEHETVRSGAAHCLARILSFDTVLHYWESFFDDIFEAEMEENGIKGRLSLLNEISLAFDLSYNEKVNSLRFCMRNFTVDPVLSTNTISCFINGCSDDAISTQILETLLNIAPSADVELVISIIRLLEHSLPVYYDFLCFKMQNLYDSLWPKGEIVDKSHLCASLAFYYAIAFFEQDKQPVITSYIISKLFPLLLILLKSGGDEDEEENEDSEPFYWTMKYLSASVSALEQLIPKILDFFTEFRCSESSIERKSSLNALLCLTEAKTHIIFPVDLVIEMIEDSELHVSSTALLTLSVILASVESVNPSQFFEILTKIVLGLQKNPKIAALSLNLLESLIKNANTTEMTALIGSNSEEIFQIFIEVIQSPLFSFRPVIIALFEAMNTFIEAIPENYYGNIEKIIPFIIQIIQSSIKDTLSPCRDTLLAMNVSVFTTIVSKLRGAIERHAFEMLNVLLYIVKSTQDSELLSEAYLSLSALLTVFGAALGDWFINDAMISAIDSQKSCNSQLIARSSFLIADILRIYANELLEYVEDIKQLLIRNLSDQSLQMTAKPYLIVAIRTLGYTYYTNNEGFWAEFLYYISDILDIDFKMEYEEEQVFLESLYTEIMTAYRILSDSLVMNPDFLVVNIKQVLNIFTRVNKLNTIHEMCTDEVLRLINSLISTCGSLIGDILMASNTPSLLDRIIRSNNEHFTSRAYKLKLRLFST